jgi:hypothetical protein
MPIPFTLLCVAMALFFAWSIIRAFKSGTTMGFPMVPFSREDEPIRYWSTQFTLLFLLVISLWLSVGGILMHIFPDH